MVAMSSACSPPCAHKIVVRPRVNESDPTDPTGQSLCYGWSRRLGLSCLARPSAFQPLVPNRHGFVFPQTAPTCRERFVPE